VRAANGAGITNLMQEVVAWRTEVPVVQISLRGVPASVSAARRFVADELPGCPRADDLILAASELASNAVCHSASGEGGRFTLRVRTVPRWARVEVTDAGPAVLPSAQRNGWGLRIVGEVTDRSGATIRSDGRRTGWAEVTWPPS
jgi:anti-sigma regulatory factor (Ser/Thr protein kinase)